jgi:AraC-like DNA-binding protein
MATVTATFARVLAGAAGYTVSETGEVLSGGAVVFRAALSDGDRMTDADYFRLVEWIRETCPDRLDLVFAYGDAIRMDDLGALGLAIKTAPTLRDSLIRVERYFRLVTDTVRYRLEEAGAVARFRIERQTDPHPALDLRNECALAAFARNMTRFGGPGVALEEVTFRHACATDPQSYAGRFGCPVRFEAEANAIALRRDVLETPNRLGDAGVSDFLTAHLDKQLGDMTAEPKLADTLERYLAGGLSTGAPSAAEAARALGMSERTLFRRLSEEGQTYQGVLQTAQQALAEELLRAEDCSIAEIAFLTGFSEQSTFSRAFKRWVRRATGQLSPHRARHLRPKGAIWQTRPKAWRRGPIPQAARYTRPDPIAKAGSRSPPHRMGDRHDTHLHHWNIGQAGIAARPAVPCRGLRRHGPLSPGKRREAVHVRRQHPAGHGRHQRPRDHLARRRRV